ncbi:quercetin 2,3-dioxygenase [Nocardioides sp.]|uniref:quercetin 2,3-dioxygenase n=1 Tax=Nocardioides sp. TaxID=35761 RepID=UPI002B266595|nr:quercetin 2,3-dioxygenase [Nocardioides sp.]
MTLQTPSILARDEGEHFHFLDNLFTAKVTSEMSNDVLNVMEFVGPKNFGPPLHRHDLEDEMFYVLEGEVWFSCGGVEAVHQEGAMAWLPKGLPHQFQILSDTARVLQLTTPGQFEKFVAKLGKPADGPTLPEPAPVDGALVAQVAAEFNIEILGPPPAPVG